jgi:hypothetical protein
VLLILFAKSYYTAGLDVSVVHVDLGGFCAVQNAPRFFHFPCGAVTDQNEPVGFLQGFMLDCTAFLDAHIEQPGSNGSESKQL